MKTKNVSLLLAAGLLATPGLVSAAENWDAAVGQVNALTTAVKAQAKTVAAPAAPTPARDHRQQNELDDALLKETGRGNIDQVQALLAQGANPQTERGDGTTPLMLTASSDFADVAAALLKRGAFVNTRNNMGDTALMYAAQAGAVDIIHMLLSAPGIKVDLGNTDGDTAFLFACGAGQTDAVKVLAEFGKSDVNRHFAKPDEACLPYSLEKSDWNTAAAVLDAGADPSAPDLYGKLPIMTAAEQNQPALVDKLLARGADPRAVLYRNDVLYFALTCQSGPCPGIVGTLIKAGADGNKVQEMCVYYNESCEITPLIYAISRAQVDVAQSLIDAGVDVNGRDSIKNRTALGWTTYLEAQEAKEPATVQKLRQIEGMLRSRGAQP